MKCEWYDSLMKNLSKNQEKYGGILKTNVADNWFETSVIMYEK